MKERGGGRGGLGEEGVGEEGQGEGEWVRRERVRGVGEGRG